MDYYLKINKSIYNLLKRDFIVPLVFGLGCLIRISRGRISDSLIIIDYICLSLFSLFLTLGLIKTFKLLYWVALKKPVLSVSEIFLYDHYKDTKYYWKDIEEAVESNDILNIRLYDPIKYLDHIGHPLKRIWAKILYNLFRIKPSYKIELSHMLDTDNEPILRILNDYCKKLQLNENKFRPY